MNTYTTRIEEDPDDPDSYIITFPDQILEELGWMAGDTLIWEISQDEITIRKKQE